MIMMISMLKVITQGIVLGWKVESNWTNPFVFLTYMVAKPIASVLLVGFVFIIGSISSLDKDLFLYVFIGTTFFIYPANIIITLTYLVHEDRAKYEVLKHIYITPYSLKPYIVGRGIASAINSSISVIISLIIGLFIFNSYFALDIKLDPNINYPLLITSILLGVTAFIFLGMVLYAINLVTFKLQYSISEYTTGILFLLSGVVFPTSMLPYPLQIITDALPTKHFLNLARASILNIGNYMDDLILLALTTLAILFIAVILMHIIERKARIKGTIDRKAEY
jgi:ABC-2 type transport system permease protein